MFDVKTVCHTHQCSFPHFSNGIHSIPSSICRLSQNHSPRKLIRCSKRCVFFSQFLLWKRPYFLYFYLAAHLHPPELPPVSLSTISYYYLVSPVHPPSASSIACKHTFIPWLVFNIRLLYSLSNQYHNTLCSSSSNCLAGDLPPKSGYVSCLAFINMFTSLV